MTPRRFFVTGTDTGVGKSLVAAALLLDARARGLRALGLKPVAAGCTRQAGRLVNDDALLLAGLSAGSPNYAQVNPVALEPAIAPHVAAARAGVELRAADLARQVHDAAALGHEAVVVEGAGGWLVPLNAGETMADLAARIGYPVVLVVGLRLGCLNHALLTAAAIGAAGLPLAGWVANCLTPGMLALDENIACLEARLPALRLATIPFLGAGATPAAASTWLDATSLFGG